MLEAFAALTQALAYGGIVLGAGSVFVGATLPSSVDTEQELDRLRRGGAWLTIVATLHAFATLVLRLGDALDPSIITAVLMSNVGGVAGLRLSGAVMLLVSPASDDSFDRGMQLSAAALMLASFVFSGHAAAEGFGYGVLAALHVAVAAWWLVALLAMRGACARNTELAITLVRRFSSLAVVTIAVLVFAGVLLIVALVDLASFAVTAYVGNLAIKLSFVLLVFALAAYNKFVLTFGVLAGDAVAVAKLRRSIDIELGLIVCVLLTTAIMTTYTSPHE